MLSQKCYFFYFACHGYSTVEVIYLRGDVFISHWQYFEHVEEAEWAVQVLKATGKPVAACLCIGPEGDLNSVSPGDCAVRLVKAGMLFKVHQLADNKKEKF